MVLTVVGYVLAYRLYGRFLGRRLFKLSNQAVLPSARFSDGQDYVPTNKWVVMGHHFTSIAGTGPIVGPAIGIIWGWVPAFLWVFFGSIFMGAVHDFFALVLSVRHDGRSIPELASQYVSPLVWGLFMLVVWASLLIVIAIFGMIIAIVFDRFAEAVIPVFSEIAISILFFYLQRRFPTRLWVNTLICLALMGISLYVGHIYPLYMPEFLGMPATGLWTIVLLVYAFVASILPVQVLLQPRDYLNAWQLYIVLALLVAALMVLGFDSQFVFVAPAVASPTSDVPSLWPFLFITIACGAISGFHSLVSSGTSAKQLKKETDATFVGFGSMLVEGFLAFLVIIAVGAGIGLGYVEEGKYLVGEAAWISHYGSWSASSGLGSKLTAVVLGFANILGALGISQSVGVVIIGVFIASFAGTTLDTATRLQRYIIVECSQSMLKRPVGVLVATSIAVLSAALLAFASGADGKGALMLWPVFGIANQLIAALGLSVFIGYLVLKNKRFLPVVVIPFFIMLLIVSSALFLKLSQFIKEGAWLLSFILVFFVLCLCVSLYNVCQLIGGTKSKV